MGGPRLDEIQVFLQARFKEIRHGEVGHSQVHSPKKPFAGPETGATATRAYFAVPFRFVTFRLGNLGAVEAMICRGPIR